MVAVILPVPYDWAKYPAEEILGRSILAHEFVRPWYLVAEALGAPRRDPVLLLEEIRREHPVSEFRD